MSGQPNRYASDPADFREEYMKQLGLRASLDDMNLQANKIYKSTGSLPPQSTMADTRSTSEVLADVEKLKVSLISALKPVADASFANIIVQGIQSSPLNADGSFFTWFYQNIDTIVPLLKKKYKVGIKGDKNDAEVFIAFMADAYSKNREMNGSIKEYFDRPASGNLTGVITAGDVDALIKKYDESLRKLITNTELRADRATNNIVRLITVKFKELRTLITSDRYTRIKDFIASNSTLGFHQEIYSAYKELDDYFKLLPSSSIVSTLLLQLDKSFTNHNTELSKQILINLDGMLPPVESTQRVLGAIGRIQLQMTPLPALPTTEPIPPQPNGPLQQGINSEISRRILRNELQEGSDREYPTAPVEPGAERNPSQPLSKGYLNELGMGIYMAFEREFEENPDITHEELLHKIQQISNRSLLYIRQQDPTWVAASKLTLPKFNAVIRTSVTFMITSRDSGHYFPTEELFVKTFVQAFHETGVKGSGLKRRGRPKGSGVAIKDRIDTTKGIKPTKHYIPFGRYLINSHKLRDDIVAMKSMSGSNIKEYPSSKVSTKLGKIMKVIVGGGVPSYKDLEDLSEEEKNYLSKVAKKAQIDDKLSIPSPSKDKQEKDIHQFEVMKGEIMSGNDSKELIKEFKVLILRLSKTGALPKRDVMEIMTELIQLGY